MTDRLIQKKEHVKGLINDASDGHILSKNDLEREICSLWEWILFFQHERLIHLIVTVLFALLEALSVMIVLISGEVFSVLLPFAVLVLLIPYIRHYYILENEVQHMYRQYDRLNRCHAGDSTAEKEQLFCEK